MHSHPNDRLTQMGRLRLVNQQLEHSRNLAERRRKRNKPALRMPLARPLPLRRSSLAGGGSQANAPAPPAHGPPAVAPFSTVARAMHRLGVGCLRKLESKPAVQRCE
jgi:hypothetical protein